jgi:bifunctional UDP-N-acetylglucosamine pyrophosphorylase/glucosamine-1-phosphate N-acetyltransferase
VAIVEHKDCTAEEQQIAEINTGMMVLPNAHLPTWLAALGNQNAQAEYYLTDVLALAVADQVAVNTLQVPNSWEAEGVNNKVQLAALERIYQANVARALLSAGVTLFDAHRLDVRGTLTHGQDVVIDVNCVFEGHVHLGDGVQIGANCVIKNCVLGAGTVVQAFSHLDGATVGENVAIGPFARLRPETVLANQVHVGNFVEIKKSSVGEGSKVNHLTYLGDASVGRKTNIGAGSVTCNYDGANKFVTTIGDNVFVGSGTLMVAPVTLEDGATIGAGTVLTKKAPAGLLTVGLTPVLSRVWTRPTKK